MPAMTLFNVHGDLVPLPQLKRLLDQGADPNEMWRSPAGQYFAIQLPLLRAATAPDGLDYLRVLLDHPDIDLHARDLQGRNALHLATSHGLVDHLALLLDAGVDLAAVDSYGNTPLHYACQAEDEQPMRLLLERGADPNTVNEAGRAALHETLMAYTIWPKPLEDKVELLLEHGAHVDQRGAMDITPLYSAASAGWTRLTVMLLERGANAQLRAGNGETPTDAVLRQLAIGPGRKGADLRATYMALVAHERKGLLACLSQVSGRLGVTRRAM